MELQANCKGRFWVDAEVREMLNCIKKEHIPDLVNNKVKQNGKIYKKVALHLKKMGYNKNWDQVKTKFKILQHQYFKIKNSNDTSDAQSNTCEYFTLLDEIFGGSSNVHAETSSEDTSVDLQESEEEEETDEVTSDESEELDRNFSDNNQKLADLWVSKLRQMPSTQQLYAEKFISDILFEGVLGNLNRNSLQINPISHFQQQNENAQDYERPLTACGINSYQEMSNGNSGVSYPMHKYQEN